MSATKNKVLTGGRGRDWRWATNSPERRLTNASSSYPSKLAFLLSNTHLQRTFSAKAITQKHQGRFRCLKRKYLPNYRCGKSGTGTRGEARRDERGTARDGAVSQSLTIQSEGSEEAAVVRLMDGERDENRGSGRVHSLCPVTGKNA